MTKPNTSRPQKAKKNVPALRFKEFEGEWPVMQLRDFTKINQGLQIAISKRFSEKTEDSYFYITNEFLRKGTKKTYFIKNPSESVICSENDILMTRTGNTGQMVTGVHGVFHNNFFKIKYDAICERWFLYYFLTSHKTQHTILKLAGASTIPDLNHGDFYRIKINLPSLPEQQKIASFLSAVDQKIQQLNRKKALLAQYKKGIMQQLFSRQIRFKDENGEDFPDWEISRIEQHFVFKNGLNKAKDFFGRGTPIINFTDVFKLNGIRKKDVKGLVELNNSEKTRFSAKKGDVFFTRTSETIFDIGMAATLLEDISDCVFSGFVLRARPINLSIVDEFKQYCFGIHSVRKEIVTKSSMTTRALTSGTLLNKVLFSFPKSKKEQQKIANFLSSLDSKLEKLGQQIAETQTFKKGLLQQLFV